MNVAEPHGCKYDPQGPHASAYSLIVHGVSGAAMPLKEGAVRWRMSTDAKSEQAALALSERKLWMLDTYHSQPTGMFSADERLAGRSPSRGVELCTIVETLYSLYAMHQALGEGTCQLIDRAERIAFSALPAALTADMWAHNYLTTINEITASRSPRKIWGDPDNSTIYGLADRFTGVTPCCTANHNQAWPKLVRAAVQVQHSPTPAIVVSMLVPTNVTMPQVVGGGAQVAVITDYPFGDIVTVVVRARSAVPLQLRIPGWATKATVAVNGDAHQPVPPEDVGAYHRVACGAGRTIIELSLNPDIRVEIGWGVTGARSASVTRGALLFALPLPITIEKLHKPWACFETGCAEDMAFTSSAPWAFALSLPGDNASAAEDGAKDFTVHARQGQRVIVNPPSLKVVQVSKPSTTPFADRAPPVRIAARVRPLPGWSADPEFPLSPAVPPVSPVACAGGACGEEETVDLVPFGSTRLRIGMFPWVEEG